MSDHRYIDVTARLPVGEQDCPHAPDPETGEWLCDVDDTGRCRTCGLDATSLGSGEREEELPR